MACACKVTQQVDYLHKKYGDKTPQSKKSQIRENVMAKVENAAIFVLLIPLIPFFAIYALIKAIRGESVHIDKILKKKKDVREQ